MRAVHGSPNQTEQREGAAAKERKGVWSRGSRQSRGTLVPSERRFRAQRCIWGQHLL